MANERRDNGAGTIYQRPNGTYQGKIYLEKKPDGSIKYKYFSGKTIAEVKAKIRDYNRKETELAKRTLTVEQFLTDWLKNVKLGSIKRSSYDAIERIARNQIYPNIGYIQIQQLTSADIRNLLRNLKERDEYSYSIIKKTYDCLNESLRHAITEKIIYENPMLSVKLPDKNLFEFKDIRFFDEKECNMIMEEAQRVYSTGRPVYVYGDAYILMMQTGLRMGEAIGLEKTDWNKVKKILRIRRNVQSVQKRNREGEKLVGQELVTNTTKTYSGRRDVPLNRIATEALERLCRKNPDSPYIISDSNGQVVPPQRLERTFYHLLKNLKLEQTGTHSLRHTFASILFAKKVDIKRISTLLGHASVKITLDTYVHLFREIDYEAVEELEKAFGAA